MNVLVDTSVWSLLLRRRQNISQPHTEELKLLIQEGRVQMAGPIRQELLTGIRDRAQFTTLKNRLRAFPDLPVETEDYETAAELSNRCREKGVQVSAVDFLLCALCQRHRLGLLTLDRDFYNYARHIELTLIEPRRMAI